jgi:hypothetical protein
MFFVMVEMIEIIGEWRGRGVFKRTARFSCDIAEEKNGFAISANRKEVTKAQTK